MIPDDLRADCQTQSCSTTQRFRREEGHENLLSKVRGNSGSVVFDAKLGAARTALADLAALCGDANGRVRLVRYGIACIDEQVEDQLAQLGCGTVDRQAGRVQP